MKKIKSDTSSRRLLVAALALALLAGCALPVPKTTLRFDPKRHSLDIRSPKDVQLTNVVVSVRGTNFTLTIGSYSSQNPVGVIKAAVIAQQNQINGAIQATETIISAATGLK